MDLRERQTALDFPRFEAGVDGTEVTGGTSLQSISTFMELSCQDVPRRDHEYIF